MTAKVWARCVSGFGLESDGNASTALAYVCICMFL